MHRKQRFDTASQVQAMPAKPHGYWLFGRRRIRLKCIDRTADFRTASAGDAVVENPRIRGLVASGNSMKLDSAEDPQDT